MRPSRTRGEKWCCAALCLWSTSAVAAPRLELGATAGLVSDLPDATELDGTRIRAGLGLGVPLRLTLTPVIRLRADVRLGFASGVDRLTWSDEVDGVTLRRVDAGAHTAYVATLGLEIGTDVVVPISGPVKPFVGGTLGGSLVSVFHALDNDTAVLLDPASNDLGNPRNLDPYTVQGAWSASVGAGITWRATERLDLLVEMGYGSAFVSAKRLRKTPENLDARREAFGWNPIRATVGLLVEL